MTRRRASILDIRGLSADERLTARALQGLVNRRGPKLFLKTGFWNWEPADQFWPDYLGREKGFDFEELSDLESACSRFSKAFSGTVVWDPDLPATRRAALSLAGVRNLLPLPAGGEAARGTTPAVHLAGRFETDLEALAWAVDEILPECDTRCVLHVEEAWSGPSVDAVDLCVAQRGFVFGVDLKPGADPRNMELFHEVLTALPAGGYVYGWGEPEESYAQAVGFHDLIVMCAEAPNLSFWAELPAGRRRWRRRSFERVRRLESRHYIALCMSEGDSPKMAVSVQGGAWLDPARGRLPINWGMNPLFIEEFPALAEFYWNTAGGNDHFIGGASGAGYTLPDKLPNPDPWMMRTGKLFRTAGMGSTEAWMHFSRPVYERYAKLSRLKSFCFPCGPYGVTLLNGGKSVAFFRGNSGLNYFDSRGTPESLAAAIRRHCSIRTKPSFSAPLLVPDDRRSGSSCGGWSPSLLAETAGLLGDEYCFVGIDEMAELAIRAVRSGRTPDCFSSGYNEWDGYRSLK